MKKKKVFSYVFVDESGDPGRPYKIGADGKKIRTGASLFYIISALPVSSEKLFLMEDRILELKNKFGFKGEIKSTEVSLNLYKSLLEVINEFKQRVFYRIINKENYKGKFAVDGNRRLHNVFDEYNLVKTVSFAIRECNFSDAEVIIDRAERRLLDGKFNNFDNYLLKKVNSKRRQRVKYVTHVNSEYVNIMQLTDLVSGALKDFCMKENKGLKKAIKKNLLRKIW